jgi:hypothetical protein
MSEVIEQLSAFELLAELGLGLAGFAGVAAAFGGRARAYDKVDLNRLMVLFACAGSVVAGSLTVITLAALGLERATIFLTVSSVIALIVGAAAFPLLVTAYRNTRERPDAAPPFALIIAAIYLVTFESLLVLNMLEGGRAGLLLAAFALTLMWQGRAPVSGFCAHADLRFMDICPTTDASHVGNVCSWPLAALGFDNFPAI